MIYQLLKLFKNLFNIISQKKYFYIIIIQIYSCFAQATDFFIEKALNRPSIIRTMPQSKDSILPEKTLTPFSPQKVEYTDQGIDVTTNPCKWDYQLVSKPIPVTGPSELSLTFEVDLKEGGFAAGFLSQDQKKFLIYKVYRTLGRVKDTLRFPFGTSEQSIHLLFANNAAEPAVSRFVIKDYTLTQVPLPPEKVLTRISPQKVEYTDQGIDVTTNSCKWDYQLMSKSIAVPDASELSLSFEVDLKKGGFAAGFLSQDQKKFLVYKTYRTLGLVKDTLKLPADTLDKSVYLLFANNAVEPAISHFVIKSIQSSQKPLQDNLKFEEYRELIIPLHKDAKSLPIHAAPTNILGSAYGDYEVEGKKFKLQNVSGVAMRCFFHSIGIEADGQITLFKRNSNNPIVRYMVANEIITAASNDPELPSQIQDAINFQLYQQEIKPINDLRNQRNLVLAQQPVKSANDTDLTRLPVELQNETLNMQERKIVEALRARAFTLKAFDAFVNYHLKSGELMVAVPDMHGDEAFRSIDNPNANYSSIDAIAYLNNFGIKVATPEPEKGNKLRLTHQFIPEGATKIIYIYHSGMHFQALIPQTL